MNSNQMYIKMVISVVLTFFAAGYVFDFILYAVGLFLNPAIIAGSRVAIISIVILVPVFILILALISIGLITYKTFGKKMMIISLFLFSLFLGYFYWHHFVQCRSLIPTGWFGCWIGE